MTAQFADVAQWILQAEGGYVHHPQDRGGETNYGITWPTLILAVERKIVSSSTTISKLTPDEALAIYEQLYWRDVGCQLLRPDVALWLFDAAVHHGQGNAIRILQKALMIEADGKVGPATVAAAKDVDIARLLAARAVFMADIVIRDASQRAFLRGWLTRLFHLHAECVRLAEEA